MKPLSAITAPILAQLYADRAERMDRAAADVRRLERQNNELNNRLEAGLAPAQANGRDRT